MITAFFINIGAALVGFFASVLPDIDVPDGWVDAVELVWGYMQSFSFLLPVATFASVLGIAVAFHAALFGYDLSLKIYHMIRGK